MSELSPEARAIIDAGRDGDAAGDLERARVRRALFAKLAAGGGAALASSSVAAAQGTAPVVAVAATTAMPLAKILVPLAILAAGSVGGTLAWHARGAAPTHAQPAVAFVAPTPRVAAPPPADVPVPVVIERPAPRHTVSRPTTLLHEAPVTTNRLAEETALLASANAALRAGDGGRALALLDDYDHRYPAGVLREEVLATRIIARCELDGAGAAASADAFLARHPKSPLAPRVRASCGR